MTHIIDWSNIKTHPTIRTTLIEVLDALIGGIILLMVVGMSAGVLFLVFK